MSIGRTKLESLTETELALSLRDYWYIACRSADLRSRPLARTILGHPIVLFRDPSHAPAVVIDRCAHRQMQLSRGTVSNGAIECPYHGWRYAADGRCVSVPSLSDLPVVRIRSWRAVEQDGYVWVYGGEGDPSCEPFRFPHCGDRRWTTFRFATRFEAGAFSCLENFLDVPHTAYVHRGWFRSRKAREVQATVRVEKATASVEFDEEAETQSVVARLLFPKGGKLTHTDRFVMPAISRVDYSFGTNRHFIITSQSTPVSEHETDVHTVITFRHGALAPLVRLYFQPLSRRILRQDIELLRRLTAHQKQLGTSFRFVPSDLLGPEILRLWRAAVEGKPVEESVRRATLRF